MNTLNHKMINYNKVFDHRPRLARYLTREKNISFYIALKRHVFLEGGATAPNAPPQLRHCFFNFIKKETVVQVFSCKFSRIL